MATTGESGLSFQMEQGSFVYLSIQNSQDLGSVECIIEVSGTVIAHNAANGAHATATCDGRA